VKGCRVIGESQLISSKLCKNQHRIPPKPLTIFFSCIQAFVSVDGIKADKLLTFHLHGKQLPTVTSPSHVPAEDTICTHRCGKD